jgi:hypothetical protein
MLRAPSSKWAAGLLGLYVVGVAPTLGQSLLESHAYRQTQTAYTAVLFAERGIDLLRPPLPVLGPPGVLPLEFPIFQALGSLVMEAGVAADAAMRLTGLVSFLGSAVILFLLARAAAGHVAAVVTLAAFLFNGHAWLYGRTSLIEYLATAGGLAFLLFGSRWIEQRRPAHWLAALLAGMVGVLAKITTGAFYLLPLLVWRNASGRWGFQHPSVWLLLVGAAAVGLGWSAYSDALRASQPATEFLATRNQYGWFFGDLAQRLEPSSWRVPLVAVLTLSGFGAVVWFALAARFLRTSSQRWFLAAMLSMVVVVPLVFFNLYAIHDYYFAAIAPLIALAVGTGAAWLWDHMRGRRMRLLAVGLMGAWVATIIGTAPTWSMIYSEPAEQQRTLAVARFIRSNSDENDWIVIDGFGWNSAFLYYARRQGFAVPDESTRQDTTNLDVDAILSDPIFGPFFTCDRSGACTVSETR